MLSEFKKSIESILYQRVTSPLYGTIAATWLLWNWKIWYITLFVDADKLLPMNKLDYLVSKCDDINRLIIFPLISTFVILTLIPFVVNGAYWLDMNFKTWRVNQKSKIEGKQLLTLEKSIQLRKEISDQEERFDKLLDKKDEEIIVLQKQIGDLSRLKSEIDEKEEKINEENSNDKSYIYSGADYRLLLNKKEVYDNFEKIVKSLQETTHLPDDIPQRMIDFLVINGIIGQSGTIRDKKSYYLTAKGQELYKVYFNANYK